MEWMKFAILRERGFEVTCDCVHYGHEKFGEEDEEGAAIGPVDTVETVVGFGGVIGVVGVGVNFGGWRRWGGCGRGWDGAIGGCRYCRD